MTVTRVFVDDTGVTHFAELEIALADAGQIGRLSAARPAEALVFRETTDAYDYDWHPAPRRQWVVLLDGEIEIETGDGVVRRFCGGEILLLEDTHGRGHRTRQISRGIRRSLFISLTQNSPTP